jgi:hypothetical protein
MARLFGKHFAVAIAALSSVATLLTVLFKLDWIKENWIYGIVGTVVVLGFSIIYALYLLRSKKNIVLDLSSELKLSISEGDIFQKKGVICVPFNEYFDTHIGGGVVDKDSTHGKFIEKYFKDRIPELQEKIQKGLAGLKYENHSRRLDCCPNRKYELGTCIDIRDGENIYVLFALTHFDDHDIANVSRAEYTEVVWKLMKHLNNMVEGRSVYMPLFGTKYSRMRRTPQRILLHLVDTLDFNDTFVIPGGVNIIIESLGKVNVNLTTLEYVVKQGISKDD